MVGDPLADMLTRIKNASAVQKEVIEMPFSKLRMDVLSVLEKKGYIKKVSKKGRKTKKVIEVELVYVDSIPKVSGGRRISKLSRRVYIGFRDVMPVKQGKGMSILSTPDGVMSGDDARKKKVGGEVLLEIW